MGCGPPTIYPPCVFFHSLVQSVLKTSIQLTGAHVLHAASVDIAVVQVFLRRIGCGVLFMAVACRNVFPVGQQVFVRIGRGCCNVSGLAMGGHYTWMVDGGVVVGVVQSTTVVVRKERRLCVYGHSGAEHIVELKANVHEHLAVGYFDGPR